MVGLAPEISVHSFFTGLRIRCRPPERISRSGQTFGRSLALTSNDEANSLASRHLREIFARSEIYQLVPHGGERGREESMPQHLRG